MRKIGLLGGTFDPIHFGHINLAIELKEKGGLDEVWFIPAQVNPFKITIETTNFEHRYRMLQLALEGIPSFKINDIEKSLPSPSFTIITLKTLYDQLSEKNNLFQFYLLLGEDSLPNFLKWRSPEEIVKIAPLLIGSRAGFNFYEIDEKIRNENIFVAEAVKKGYIKTKLMDICATDLRERLHNKLYCGHLVPESVLKYIEKNGLYSIK